jgi:hypothetical protein
MSGLPKFSESLLYVRLALIAGCFLGFINDREERGSKFLRNVNERLLDYTASHCKSRTVHRYDCENLKFNLRSNIFKILNIISHYGVTTDGVWIGIGFIGHFNTILNYT